MKNLYMLSELAQYAIQDFCSSHGWVLSSFEGNYKLPKDLFLVDAELDLNVTFLPGKFLKSRSTSTQKGKDVMSDSDSVKSSEMPLAKLKAIKKRKKVFGDVENTIVRRNASRKARNVAPDGTSDVENELQV